MITHPITVLAIDPAKVSGWAIFEHGRLIAHGVAESAEERAAVFTEHADRIDVVVREKFTQYNARGKRPGMARGNFDTYIGLGAAWGRWAEQIEIVGLRRIVGVTAMVWRGAVLGGMRQKRDDWKALAVRSVEARFGVRVTDDEAEAILIGFWATKAPEVWDAIPAREQRRLAQDAAPA